MSERMGSLFPLPPQRYFYRWGHPYFGGTRKGHVCTVLYRGKMNQALVAWENGGTDIISRNALRKVRPDA